MTGHILYGNYRFDNKDKKDPWKAESPAPLLDPFNRFVRFILKFSNGKYLALSDMRRFAKVTHIHKSEIEKSKHLEKIGPEPLPENFTREIFCTRLLMRPNMPVKLALMNQELIAGIGNIYSDEILWHSGVLPQRKVSKVTPKEFEAMYKAMKETLKKGIDFGGDSMSDYRNILGKKGKFQEKHNAYRRTGQKCKKARCGGIIRRTVLGARSAHFCDTHQK